MPTGNRTSFGQYQSTEPIENLTLVHRHDGVTPLREVDHEPKLATLDQEDLLAQGIDTSALVPGAPRVDALGSCTANATTVGVSNLGESVYVKYLTALDLTPKGDVDLFTATALGEQGAIVFYHDETGLTSSPWPPTDSGCTGPVLVEKLQALGVVTSQRIAHGAQDLVSLLQTDGVLEGGPFLNAWMEPPATHVVDGNGTTSELEAQIRQGVAGGHETYISGIVKLSLTETGQVVPEKTILKVRNSWSKNYGDAGSFYLHLSTLVALGRYYDFRQLVA